MFRITGKYTALATLVAGTFVASLGAAPAYAERHVVEAVSIRVAYGDLDLSNAAGVEALYQRLRAAARSACDERGKRINEIVAYDACYSKALGRAVSGFNSELLTALHEQSEERAS
jgi:UrcA family protein